MFLPEMLYLVFQFISGAERYRQERISISKHAGERLYTP